MKRQCFRRPGTKGVDDSIEPGKIVPCEVEEVLFNDPLGKGMIGVTNDGRYVKALGKGFLYNQLTGFSISGNNGNFHDEILL